MFYYTVQCCPVWQLVWCVIVTGCDCQIDFNKDYYYYYYNAHRMTDRQQIARCSNKKWWKIEAAAHDRARWRGLRGVAYGLCCTGSDETQIKSQVKSLCDSDSRNILFYCFVCAFVCFFMCDCFNPAFGCQNTTVCLCSCC